MAAMSTSLTELIDNGNSITYFYTGHTVNDPKLVLQKRKVPVGATGVAEDSFSVVVQTDDADGNPLSSKPSFEAKHRRPINGDAADSTAALAVFRDIVASDEFGAMVTNQARLK